VSDSRVEVRAAGVADAGILASIGSNSFRDAYAEHSGAADLEAHVAEYFTAAVVRREIEQHNSDYLLASVSDRPGGIAKYRNAACPVPGIASNAMELQQLYVSADMQRHGLGRQLLARLMEIARQRQVEGIWLSTWQDADWAVNFYLKNGFRAVGLGDFIVGTTAYVDDIMWLAPD
jgi:GNAT superfamily N-acetyltransferase